MVFVVATCYLQSASLGAFDLQKGAKQSSNEFQEDLLKEILMAEIFKGSLENVDWITSKNFSPFGSAASYSFLYILFRVLNDCNPSSIIEFGMGQSSKLTSQYANNNKKKNAHLFVVEHDLKWINIFKSQLLKEHGNVDILHLPIEERTIETFKTTAYEGLLKNIGDAKFDLLIVDGPNGRPRFSRIGILDLIPEHLDKSFVIILDDYNRIGEQDTGQEIFKKLDQNKILYGHTIYAGIKKQLVIYSKDYSFLHAV